MTASSALSEGYLALGDSVKKHLDDAVLELPDNQHRVAARRRQLAHLEVEFHTHAADASAGDLS